MTKRHVLKNISELAKLLIIAAIAVESGQIFFRIKRISDEDNRSKQIKTELQSNFRLWSPPIILMIQSYFKTCCPCGTPIFQTAAFVWFGEEV